MKKETLMTRFALGGVAFSVGNLITEGLCITRP